MKYLILVRDEKLFMATQLLTTTSLLLIQFLHEVALNIETKIVILIRYKEKSLSSLLQINGIYKSISKIIRKKLSYINLITFSRQFKLVFLVLQFFV